MTLPILQATLRTRQLSHTCFDRTKSKVSIGLHKMLKLYPRKAHVICCIIIGSLIQAQGFSITVVNEVEDAVIECGLQTKVEGYLRWEAITNDTTVVLAIDIGDGHTACDDRITNCTLYANGSIQLESVSKEDGARHYRCLRGDDNGFNYYSDHRLLVLSKEKTRSPPSIETPHRESVRSYNMGKKGVLHGYNAPVCEDDVDGNLPVVCYPPSGITVDREYETIQCTCTNSEGLMDSVTFPVTKKETSFSPSIETPHRESVISYNMGKKGVLHAYNAPVCEDDVDGNLPVVCYPPSGVIVDREYETIQCNCTNSDGLMDSLSFPVTSITHWVHPGWWKASISLLVVILISISIIVVLIWISPNPCKNPKKSKTNHRHEVAPPPSMPESMSMSESESMLMSCVGASDREDMTVIGTKDKQISNLEEKIATLEATLNNSQTELTEREREVCYLKLELRQKEKQETEMKKKLEEQNERIIKVEKELAVKEEKTNGLGKRQEDRLQVSILQKVLADFFQQQPHTASKEDGKKYQEDDNNSEFDKNSSPSEKENKEKGSPRKGKKKDPERRLTLNGNPIVSPHETPGKNNQNDQDVETDMDDGYTTEDKKDLDKDETDFSKSKGCSDDTGPNVSRAFKEYLIDDDSECNGFNLAFTCDGTDMRIELRINEGSDGSICQFEFKNGEIIPSYRGKPEKAIGFKQGTQYDLNLGNHKRVLSLFQRNSAQGNECVKKFEQYDFVQIRLLCIYKSDTCSVSILDHLGLIEYS